MATTVEYDEIRQMALKQEKEREILEGKRFYGTENRIDAKFAELKIKNKKALITFITGGHYGYGTTEKLVLEMERAGADIIEIGVPFSDPVAEGVTIQNSSAEALAQGATLSGIFETAKRLREKTTLPLLLMLYANSVFAYGNDNFFIKCKECGIDGIIIPDLPLEEYDEFYFYTEKYNVYSIHLIAPTSSERICDIAKDAKGFIYCVSSNGVTGTRSEFSTDFDRFFKDIKAYAKVPCAVGFGISNPEQAQEMSSYWDGVIVGSAIVKLVLKHGENSPEKVYEFTKSLRNAIDRSAFR